jgi:hypothetical protein
MMLGSFFRICLFLVPLNYLAGWIARNISDAGIVDLSQGQFSLSAIGSALILGLVGSIAASLGMGVAIRSRLLFVAVVVGVIQFGWAMLDTFTVFDKLVIDSHFSELIHRSIVGLALGYFLLPLLVSYMLRRFSTRSQAVL